MGAKHQKFVIEIPDGYTSDERDAIGFEILEFIRKRTGDGKSWKNRALPGYSKEYVESLEFKIAGKSKNDVNLTLSGDMLGAMQVLGHRNGKIIIGFEDGTPENAKADGNIRGTYGKDEPTGPRRDFLGITKKDLRSEILTHYPIKDVEKRKDRTREVLSSDQFSDPGVGSEDLGDG